MMLDLEARQARLAEAIKSYGKQPSKDAAIDYVEALLALRRSVLAESLGGLLGPDSLGAQSDALMTRVERALDQLEAELLDLCPSCGSELQEHNGWLTCCERSCSRYGEGEKVA
jgi:hypothetical protein